MQEPSYVATLNGELLSRANLFKWIREFIRVNSLQNSGYYMEFGILNGEGMIQAYRVLRGILNHFFGFDSFSGLPVLSNEDKNGKKLMPIFFEGNFCGGEKEDVEKNIIKCTGISCSQLTLIDGVFNESLKNFDKKKMLQDKGKLLVCYVDCDLYSSSKDVFNFIESLVTTGTWLILDDYWLYRGHPQYGQRKAFEEWINNSEKLGYSDYGNYNGYGKAFLLYEKDI